MAVNISSHFTEERASALLPWAQVPLCSQDLASLSISSRGVNLLYPPPGCDQSAGSCSFPDGDELTCLHVPLLQ